MIKAQAVVHAKQRPMADVAKPRMLARMGHFAGAQQPLAHEVDATHPMVPRRAEMACTMENRMVRGPDVYGHVTDAITTSVTLTRHLVIL